MRSSFVLTIISLLCTACVDNELVDYTDDNNIPTTLNQDGQEPEMQIYTTKSGVRLAKMGNRHVLQGDIILTDEQVALLDESTKTRGAINTMVNRYWPKSIVYYHFAEDFNPKESLRAMDTLSHYVGITFKPTGTSYVHGNSLYFINYDGNFSQYGCIGGMQTIMLTPYHHYSTSMHEICHALGLYHEQCRVDRDDYIDILWDNIAGYAYAFDTYADRGQEGIDSGPFDFESIMMYDSYSFGKKVDGKRLPTILKKDGSLIHNSYLLSSGDKLALRQIYGPPYAGLFKETVDSTVIGTTAYVQREVYVRFFKDKAHFIPTKLDNDRILTIESYNSRNFRVQKRDFWNVTVKAGTRIYIVGDEYIAYDISRSGLRYNGDYLDVVNSHIPTYVFKTDSARFDPSIIGWKPVTN